MVQLPTEYDPDSKTKLDCLSVTPGIAAGNEYIDVPLCFGLSLGAVFECSFSDSEDLTSCKAADQEFVVNWSQAVAWVPFSGQAYTGVGGDYVALVYKHPEDRATYMVEWGDGSGLGKCNLSLSGYCRTAPHRP
jgi:hypothetical protein